jgi:hypothetical protein
VKQAGNLPALQQKTKCWSGIFLAFKHQVAAYIAMRVPGVSQSLEVNAQNGFDPFSFLGFGINLSLEQIQSQLGITLSSQQT